jgi:hypothetical protein
MKNLYLFLLFLCISSGIFASTLRIDPDAGGGFENATTTFPANGWTVVNGSANKWYIGTAPVPSAGSYCAFTGSSSTTWAGTSTSSVNHFYADITFGTESYLIITFKYKLSATDIDDDNLKVYLVSTSTTPAAGTQLSTGLLGVSYCLATSWTMVTLYANAAGFGTSARLVFSWRNDTGTPYSACAVDEVSVTSAVPDPLHGTYSVDNTLPTTSPMEHDGTGNFASFTDAVTYLNGQGTSAAVTFNVAAGEVFNENIPVISAAGTSPNTITFQKSGSGNNPKITPTGSAGLNDAGILIAGGDYFTFDGIDIDASAVTTVEYGFMLRSSSATNGAQYNTLKNFTVTLNRGTTTSNLYSSAIMQSVSSTQGGVTPTAASGANSYNKYYNFTIQNAINGFYVTGNSTYPDQSCEIGTTDCSIRNTIVNIGPTVSTSVFAKGISTFYQLGIKIFNNDISAVAGDQATPAGLYLSYCLGTTNDVYGNKIFDISVKGSTSSSITVYGIWATLYTTGTNSLKVYNNFVGNIYSSYTGSATASRYVCGIYFGVSGATSSQSYDLDNNSVSIGAGLTPTYSNTCIELANALAIYHSRGNIFANFSGTQSGVARHYGMVVTDAAVGATGTALDYNDYFTANDLSSSGCTGRNNTTSTNYNTLADWQAFTTGTLDDTSFPGEPLYTSNNSDLHANGTAVNAVTGFVPQAWIVNDIDCQSRATLTPNDVGADGFDPPACSPPAALTITNITYTTATLSWSAPTFGTPPSGYNWEVRTSGLPGTGSAGLVSSGSTISPVVTVSLTGLAGGTAYMVYVQSDCGGGSYSMWAGNSFSTLSCNIPTGVSVSSITVHSATISWIAPLVGSPAGYEYEVRTSGAAGSGTTGLFTSGSTLSPVVSADLTGLAAATQYYVYVRTLCYAGFYSSWTSSTGFLTLCDAVIVPYLQDFESVTPPAIPLCSSVQNAGTGNNWITANVSGYGFSSKVLEYPYSTTNAANAWFYTPGINLSCGYAYRLTFKYGNNSTSYTEKLRVLYGTSPVNTSMTNLICDYPSVNQATVQTSATYIFPQSSGTYYIGFNCYSDMNQYYLYVDDISLITESPCPAPWSATVTSLTCNSATIMWYPAGMETAWQYAYGPAGTAPPCQGTSISTTSVTLTGLAPSTSYYFYLRTLCGPGLYSAWAGPYSFSTMKALSLGSLYLEGFYAGGNLMNPAYNCDGLQFQPDTADLITVELHDPGSYSNLMYSTPAALTTAGTVLASVPNNLNGSYYLTIRHSNSIETTSALPVSVAGSATGYSFNAQSQAYGGNMTLFADGKAAIYSGDENQDGLVDGTDLSDIGNLADFATCGYLSQDINGDGLIDGSDLSICGNNADYAIGAVTP